jgi:hypothetical protein
LCQPELIHSLRPLSANKKQKDHHQVTQFQHSCSTEDYQANISSQNN